MVSCTPSCCHYRWKKVSQVSRAAFITSHAQEPRLRWHSQAWSEVYHYAWVSAQIDVGRSCHNGHHYLRVVGANWLGVCPGCRCTKQLVGLGGRGCVFADGGHGLLFGCVDHIPHGLRQREQDRGQPYPHLGILCSVLVCVGPSHLLPCSVVACGQRFFCEDLQVGACGPHMGSSGEAPEGDARVADCSYEGFSVDLHANSLFGLPLARCLPRRHRSSWWGRPSRGI
mmetsp:Transcript_35870/g.90186  ORF Transcript_35870/g.90186 Transcript_35870/m.90186 type:complete len:227 (+) Transcript_35870:1503-2183(+)